MAMTRTDYKMIADTLHQVGIEEQEAWSSLDPGACWWKVLARLEGQFEATDPHFNSTKFRSMAIPNNYRRGEY